MFSVVRYKVVISMLLVNINYYSYVSVVEYFFYLNFANGSCCTMFFVCQLLGVVKVNGMRNFFGFIRLVMILCLFF